MSDVVAAGTGATPAAFYLGLCRLRGILSLPASATVILQEGRSSAQLRWCCRRAVLSCNSDDAASIPKSGLEIKNQCTKEGVNRQKLASIRKSEPEIKNQCSRGVVSVCRRNHSPLPLRKLESDAALVAATTTAGGPFFSAAKKIRIRRGDSLQKAAHPQTIPQHAFHHAFHHALPTRLALDVCMGTGSTQVRQWRQKRVLMRPEAAFPYVSAAEGAQHPPKKPPRSTALTAAPAQKPPRSTVSRNENKHKKQYLC